MANPTATYGDLLNRIARRGHKNRNRTGEEADVQHWAQAGIERVENEMPWNHLRTTTSFTLVADQYNYDLPNAISRLDAESLRAGGEGSYLIYQRRPENIDSRIGPQWKDSSTDPGTPEYWCEHASELWIGPKPDADYVAANPTLYCYAWATDLYVISQIADVTDATEVNAVSLRIPLRLRELYVVAALAEGLQQEDDPDWGAMDSRYENLIVKIRGDREVVRIDTRPQVPDWAHLQSF